VIAVGDDLERTIKQMTDDFFREAQDAAGQKEYIPLYGGHERHGVWEWRASKQSDRLRRYVILTVNNLEDETSWRDMQLYVGADDDRAFMKRLVVRSIVSPFEMNMFIDKHGPDAYRAAETLTEDDLDTMYNQPRHFPPDQTSSSMS
jgi:hypothetical protein